MCSEDQQRQYCQQNYNHDDAQMNDSAGEMDFSWTLSPISNIFNQPSLFLSENQTIASDMMRRYFSGENYGTGDNCLIGNNTNGLIIDESHHIPKIFPDHPMENGTIGLGNIWNVFEEKDLRHSLGWTVTLVVAYALILVIGIVGNIMVILVVALRPQMRTVTNMFIMNLAVADLFVIVFCVPATLLANVFTPWILGSFMCKAVTYVQGISVGASAYSLVAISLDRCKAIYQPMERPRGLSKSQALFTICLIWIFALLMTIPCAVIFNVVTSEKDGLSYCVETWENKQHGNVYFLVVNLILCYCIPLALICISNVSVWCFVSHRKVPQDSASANIIKQMHRQARHGVRKMLSIVTLTFLLSWLPLYILVTRVKFSKKISEGESNMLEILMPLAQWLGSWNSSINPVLYAFLNGKFREMFKSLLPSWLPFVPRNNTNPILRNNFDRETWTNGAISVTVSKIYSDLLRNCTVRSSNNSRQCHYSKQGSSSPRTLPANKLQTELPSAPSSFRETETVLVSGTPRVRTVSVWSKGGEKQVPRLKNGKNPPTTRAIIVTDV